MDAARILVADDDRSICQVVKRFLEGEGFTVLTVGDGQQALDVVGSFEPDVILLDLRMPVMDGFEFAKRYRSSPEPHAGIVAFVASLNADDERIRMAADTALEKPFDLEDLLGAISEASRHNTRSYPVP